MAILLGFVPIIGERGSVGRSLGVMPKSFHNMLALKRDCSED